jgi:hypothetical protein
LALFGCLRICGQIKLLVNKNTPNFAVRGTLTIMLGRVLIKQ